MENEVKVLMTSGGQVVVARVSDEGDSYSLSNPAALIPTGGDANSLMLLPWIPYATEQAEGTMTLCKSFVVSVMTPVDACVEEFTRIEMTSDEEEEAVVGS